MLHSKLREIQCFRETTKGFMYFFFPQSNVCYNYNIFKKKKLALLPKKKTVIKMCSNNQDKGPTEI